MKTNRTLIIVILTLFFACKKDQNESIETTKLAEVPYFKAGNGFSYLASYSQNNGGAISFMKSVDISVTADGKLHWLFSRTNPFSNGEFLYRKIMDATTGNAIGDGDLQTVGGGITFNAYDRGLTDKFGFVPYTDKIYRAYRSGDAKFKVEGEVASAEYGGYDGTAIKADFYANGIPTLHFAWNIKANLQDINTRIGAYEVRNNKLTALADVNKTFWSYGKADNFDKLYHGGISFPTGIEGSSSAFGFTQNKAYLFKKIGNQTLPVDSTTFSGVPFYTGSVVPNVPFLAKTSRDLKTTVLLCYEPDSYTKFSGKYNYSTFIINNNTNKITIAVNQFAMAKTDLDFDLSGNIYYPVQPNGKESAQVMKVSGKSESVFAKNFFDSNLQIRNLQVVDDKVYITALTSTDKMVSRISLFVAR